ncbi:Outer membrane efflux protein [Stieleria maiorica]|uniref:Outer membrane efflux protein n=1 Tax=Stieleria maiorica TaxID=2795974 RepID=A0A5B9MMB2_9BACT|nr:TolC family protein [Stieleria maiorica]QEG02443.1 Outer membrane efflux protein [Stieleria maiorica]
MSRNCFVWCFTLPLVGLFPLFSGCSRKHYRTQADQDVAAIYAETRCEEAYTLPPLAGIDVDPRSRFFDPSPEDCPALPLPEPQLYGYQLPQLATGDPNLPRKRSDIESADGAEELPPPGAEELPLPEAEGLDLGPLAGLEAESGTRAVEGFAHTGTPRSESGRGAGDEGPNAQPGRRAASDATTGRLPPHPQPFSPAKPGEKGAITNLGDDDETGAISLASGEMKLVMPRSADAVTPQVRLAELIRENEQAEDGQAENERAENERAENERAGDAQADDGLSLEGGAGEAAENQPDWDPTADNRQDTEQLRIVPIPDEFWQQLPETCVPRMLEFESVREEFRRSYPRVTTAGMTGMLSDAPRLTLPMITELASLNNRAIQTQKERLYRAALVLSGQRYEYVLRPTRRGNGSGVTYTHVRLDSTTRDGLVVPTETSVRKTTAIAGQFLASFANSVVFTFNGPQGFAADIGSDLVFDFQQTIFQRDVVFEGLTRAERNVVYEARNLIRAQRALFVDLASDYYQLLLTYRAIEISSQDYFSNLRAFLQGRAEYLQAGRIPRVQVDQFEQNALDSRSSLVGACNTLESALDRLKLSIGLPPEMPLNLNLEELESLTASDELTVTRQLVMRTRRTLLDAAQIRLGDRDAAVNGATVLINRLRETLRVRRKIEGVTEVTDAERETETLALRLALLEARLQSDQLESIRSRELNSDLPPPALIQFARTIDLVESTLSQSERAVKLRADLGLESDVADAVTADQLSKQFYKLRRQWDSAIEDRELDQLPELVEKADALLKETDALKDRLVGDLLPEDGVDFENVIVQTVADTVALVDRVETSDIGGLDEVQVEQEQAMLLALYQRYDLMNRRGELADDRRQIKLAADDLRSILDIRATQTLSANRFEEGVFDFTADGSTSRLGLALDTPLNRRLERNTYRAALIDYQAGRRALIDLEDQIKFAVREDLRQLRLQRNQYEISVARAALAYERVVSTRLQLQLAVGNVVARDFLEAQQAFTSALNSVARDHISFIRRRIELFFDTESIRLDANGYWSGGQDDSLELPPLPDFYDANPNPWGRLPKGVRYSDEVRQNH